MEALQEDDTFTSPAVSGGVVFTSGNTPAGSNDSASLAARNKTRPPPPRLPAPVIREPERRKPVAGKTHQKMEFSSNSGYSSYRGSSRMSRPAMDLPELHTLREHLVKQSVIEGSSFGRVTGFDNGPLGGSQEGGSDIGGSGIGGSGIGLPRMTGSMYGRPTMGASGLPRESVAVLIEAVRGSALDGDNRARFLFDLFDVDGKGVITRHDVAGFIEGLLVSNKLKFYGDDSIDKMVENLFAKNLRNSKQMTYSEFARIFANALSPPENPGIDEEDDYVSNAPEMPKKQGCCGRLTSKYRKHAGEIHSVVIYLLLMGLAFFVKARLIDWDIAVGYWPRIAKGFAQICMVDTMCLLLPMCRTFVALVRKSAWVTKHVPVDQNIEFHKLCGIVMLIASLGHSAAWIMIVYYARTVPDEVWEESHFSHLSYVRYEDYLKLMERTPIWSGVMMLLIALVAAPMTHPKFRRGNFNIFWLTHLFFLVFLALIVAHGLAMWVEPPQAAFWVIPPLLLYGLEKRYRLVNVFKGRTSILRAQVSNDTVAIYMRKPKNFHYQAGMYMFLHVPMISPYEWHPFTISSAPEDDHLSVHVRNAGDWTGALHALLKQIQSANKTRMDMESNAPANMTPYPSICIDGPVGAPSQDFYRYRTVVFVGAGIGVTPFASILRSIVYQWQSFRCPCCHTVTFPATFQLRKIYFYWSTRDQESLTWFSDTMNQLAAMDSENRLEIHNYFSTVKDKSVIAPLQALQTFIHDVDGHDFISGLSTKQMTHFGRPDWKKEFNRIAKREVEMKRKRLDDSRENHNCNGGAAGFSPPKEDPEYEAASSSSREEVGVFYCGPKPLGASLHEECTRFNQADRRHGDIGTVNFDFHSENF
ncbi:hypothetical protein Poli38472_009214 [Pythium oligandrum]|uniref:Uncharacterized protein n=1 Tax=Pythium oligandrum TaxID=41045 RepID=A0A8K1CKB7_PYTOL|nr:hypothetical protein Poli38472_009214 [Pythium oligandrum]|eukprot:TMW65047.1 hypothetical protein Poli38472_009214 [Pythium oligandrum]